MMLHQDRKHKFETSLREFVERLTMYTAADNGYWSVKGIIDVYQNVYAISSDTKIVSKILETHIFPEILKFSEANGYRLVLPNHQNYYPDFLS